MKKQLFIAFFILTFPFFAVAKPNNAALLIHLKNIKIEISNILDEMETELNKTPENAKEIKFLFLSNIANEVLIKSELWRQELLILEQYCYNTICNNLKTYFDTTESARIYLSTDIDSIPTNIKDSYQPNENISPAKLYFLLRKLYSNNILIEKHYQLVQSIYTKHYNHYIKHNPQEILEPTSYNYNFDKIEPLDGNDNLDDISLDLHDNMIEIYLLKKLSQKITAQIKKLEKA